MRIDPISRAVYLNVRELAAFRNVPTRERSGRSPWRAVLGQKWHKESEVQTSKHSPEATFEVTIAAQIMHRDWTFHVKGRVDQIIPTEDTYQLREVKTVRTALPASATELAATYPEYFAQVAIYLGLARILPDYADRHLTAELQFIDIETGALQAVALCAADEALFETQLDRLIPFLEDRRACRIRLNEADIAPAFTELREGQAELFAALDKAALQSKTVLLEAPTGFGKTGIVLEHALNQMKNGVYERCIYLTSKSTGQLETIHQLRQMIGDQVRYIQMRNRREHSIESTAHTCTGDSHCDEHLGQNWTEAAIHPPELFNDGTLTLESSKAIGAQTGICPYSLTKGCLPFAEIWVGDSNYVFAPASQSMFLEQSSFDANKTLLVIDEAHNLPSRVADALSVEINSSDLVFALEELKVTGAGRRLLSIGTEIIRCIDDQPSGQPLSANAIYELTDLCEDFSRELKEVNLDYDSCAPFALEVVWSIPDLAHRLNEPSHEWLYWIPNHGALRANCLDARQWIATCLKPFGGNLLMSATISPVDHFRDSCGLVATETTVAIGYAPWRENAYNVAIDCRVDTRFKRRESYYELTARTISTLISESPGVPIAVFFASYQYAKNIQTYLEAIDPNARAMLQPRGVDLEDQETFIDEGLLIGDALFLILGSSYAEGVDKLGGRIQTVMIVGPALPEVNAVQQAKLDAHPSLSRDECFRDVYIRPAMQRIHQALGRIVRAPGQNARVLLHGKRFAESAYRAELATEYQDGVELRNEPDLAAWLNSDRHVE